ncbi:MAG: hypothetical protein R3A50_12155 [Saprospiraceae bacterium]
MEITLPISSLVIIAVSGSGVLFSLLVGTLLISQQEKKHISISLLGILLILSGLTLLNDLLTTSGISNRYKSLYFIPIFYSLSIGPLFYLFVKSKFRNRLRVTDYLHLLAPLMQALIYLGIGFRSIEFKSELYNNSLFRQYLTVESFVFPVFLLIYLLLSLQILKRCNTETHFWQKDLKLWLLPFQKHRLSLPVGTKVY